MNISNYSNSVVDDGNLEPSIRKYFLIGALVFLIVWMCVAIFAPPLFPKSLENYSKIGDAFGVVNSLFSGAALLGAIIAIILQYHELKSTNSEMRRSAIAQGEIAKHQSNILKLESHKELLKLYSSAIKRSGHDAGPIQQALGVDDTAARQKVAFHARKIAEFMEQYPAYFEIVRNNFRP